MKSRGGRDPKGADVNGFLFMLLLAVAIGGLILWGLGKLTAIFGS